MNIKIHSSELNRMMKTVSQCIDPKSQKLGNIEVIYDNNLLTIRGTNGAFSAVVSTPLLGGDGEVFCVDGTMFAKVIGMCSGEISISTDEKTCTVKGAGRTRLPIVNVKIPAFETVAGNECKVRAEDFAKGFNSVSYAISTDQNRVVLTGVLVDTSSDCMKMVTLDGFKMAVENVKCEAQDMKIIIPGAFMKLISTSTIAGEDLTIRSDGKRVQASTDSVMLACALLSGEFPDYLRMLPASFKTETAVGTEAIQSALKCGSVVNTSNNLIKLNITANDITVMSNSEQADFDAEVSCLTQGDPLKIAFNHKYLMETINSFGADEIVMQFNSSISPCVVQLKESNGFRLLLPVRTVGWS